MTFFRQHTLLKKNVVTPPFEAIKSIWIDFLCFQLAGIDMKFTCDCSRTIFQPYHGRTFTSMPSGIMEVQNRSLDGHFPNLPSHCDKFESTIVYFSQFSLIVLMPRPTLIGIKHEVFVLAHEGMRKVLLLVAWVWLVLLSTASSRGMLPLELWCQASPRFS